MIKCREAARLISDSQERPLRFAEWAGLRLHLFLCRFCARYGRQVKLLARLCEQLAAEDGHPGPGAGLSEEARERIRSRLRR